MNHLDCTPSLDDQALDCDDVQLSFEEHACVTIVSKRLGFGCSTSNPDDHAHLLYQGKQYTIKVEKQREYAIHGPDGELISRLKLDALLPPTRCTWLATSFA